MMVGRYHFERVDSGPLATRLISILRLARPLRMASVDAEASPFPKQGPGMLTLCVTGQAPQMWAH